MTKTRRPIGVLVLLALSGSLVCGSAYSAELQSLPRSIPRMTAGELTSPFDLGSGRAIVATREVPTTGQSLRLLEMTVLNLRRRSIGLRFTLKGVPPPTFQNPGIRDVASNRPGTLMTVETDALVRPR
jgi:hypothetical protein